MHSFLKNLHFRCFWIPLDEPSRHLHSFQTVAVAFAFHSPRFDIDHGLDNELEQCSHPRLYLSHLEEWRDFTMHVRAGHWNVKGGAHRAPTTQGEIASDFCAFGACEPFFRPIIVVDTVSSSSIQSIISRIHSYFCMLARYLYRSHRRGLSGDSCHEGDGRNNAVRFLAPRLWWSQVLSVPPWMHDYDRFARLFLAWLACPNGQTPQVSTLGRH